MQTYRSSEGSVTLNKILHCCQTDQLIFLSFGQHFTWYYIYLNFEMRFYKQNDTINTQIAILYAKTKKSLKKK